MIRAMLAYFLMLAFAGCADFRIGYGSAGRIAKDLSIVGKGVPRQCLPYASELCRRLTAAGYEARVICFEFASEKDFGSHAFTLFKDTDGKLPRYYAQDSQSFSPREVRAPDPLTAARWFTGPSYAVIRAR